MRYVLEHGDSLEFTKYFWKGCEPIEPEVIQYHKFVECRKRIVKGWKNEDIALEVDASKSTVYTWRNLIQMPKLAHFLKALLTLGIPPTDRVWLTIECSHGHGIPIGDFIAVPLYATSWNEIACVLPQLRDINEEKRVESREYLFGFLTGVIMGDANKPKSKQGASHRHIDLVLSKKYETNVLIGDYTCVSARSIGLRMLRTKDLPKPANKPNGFYEWVSQASPLVDWIYNVALGLRDDELTTYNPVRADWMLSAPRDFRVGLINGIAESDGSVSIASQEVEFWVDPHRDLLKRILAMEGLQAFNNRQALTLSKSHAIKSFLVPIFCSALRTVRYQRHEMMATARRFGREERLPDELRAEIRELARSGMSVPKIVESIASTKRILISFEAAKRWTQKPAACRPRKD